ncbi:hypothetical protein B6F84_10310 [Acidianus manzaensis]|uniref:Uncharacterized protein n=1 Tax=Acidianus manzaensis TaxID=282676 RepID=A0A1W6K3T5_9CREN|nr:hypothetical protein B6F84_10310 [Acidianus manzaensis]
MAIKYARKAKQLYCDKARKDWWYRQWHSAFESIEYDLRRGFIDLSYETLEQAEFHASVMASPAFSKASIKQSRP